jgi:hypothetical protein
MRASESDDMKREYEENIRAQEFFADMNLPEEPDADDGRGKG